MKRYNPKVDDCVVAIVIVFAVPTVFVICAVIMRILDAWGGRRTMRVTVSITFTPDLPEHRTLDAESTFDAMARVLGEPDTRERFERCKRKGGGNIVISAFSARAQVDYTLRGRAAKSEQATVGGPLFQ